MNNLFQIVNVLEKKLVKLLQKHKNLQDKCDEISQLKINLEEKLLQQHQQYNDLEKKYESLRIANSIVGSKEDKHFTKLKINTLIREIDKCITQLSD